jgi:hypothetical protein
MPTKAHAQAVDLDDRLRASTALEREASGRSAQQATSLAALETRAFNSSSPSNGIMLIASDSLCVHVFDRVTESYVAAPVQSNIIVSCSGGQHIIIILSSSGSHDSG